MTLDEQIASATDRSLRMPINQARQSELWKLLKDAHPGIDPLELLDVMSEVLTYLVVGEAR